jgi:hypothetical protein
MAALGLRCSTLAFTSWSDWGLLLLQSRGSRRGLQQWLAGLVAQRHVGSSRTKDQTCIPCIGRWILSRWPTREAPGTWHLLSKCLLITWLLPPVPPLTAAAESPLCRLPCSHPALCCVRRVPCHHPLAFTALAVSQAAVWTRCVLRTVPGETLVPRPGTPRWAEPLR